MPNARWTITIDQALSDRVEVLLFDEVLGKPGYGERAQLIERLLRQWIAEHSSHQSHPDLFMGIVVPISTGNLTVGVGRDHILFNGTLYTSDDISIIRDTLGRALRVQHQHRKAKVA